MFKSIALLAIIAFVSGANAGLIAATHTTHVVEPTLAKVGAVVHSVPSAVSHQSFTRVHSKAHVTEIVAPVVRSVQVAPVVKAVPVQHVVKTVEVAPIVKSVEVHAVPAPVVSHVQYTAAAVAAPVVKTYVAAPTVHHVTPIVHSAPIVHASPIVKTVVSPVTYTAIHH